MYLNANKSANQNREYWPYSNLWYIWDLQMFDCKSNNDTVRSTCSCNCRSENQLHQPLGINYRAFSLQIHKIKPQKQVQYQWQVMQIPWRTLVNWPIWIQKMFLGLCTGRLASVLAAIYQWDHFPQSSLSWKHKYKAELLHYPASISIKQNYYITGWKKLKITMVLWKIKLFLICILVAGQWSIILFFTRRPGSRLLDYFIFIPP